MVLMTFVLDDLLADLRSLVEVESPSLEIPAVEASAAAVADLIERQLGSAPELVASPAGPHVHWRGDGEPRVLLVGHHDTVFPPARWRPGRSPWPTAGSAGRGRST